MKLNRIAGATSEIWQVFIADSSSTTGAGLTGLVFNTSNLVAYYHRDIDTTATAITLVDMTVGTFTSGGFKEISASNMPGWYQFCPPNTALATAAKSCAIHLKGAANMAPLPIEVDLDSQVDIRASLGIAVTNEDFTMASATASTITLPATDSAGNSIADNDQFAGCALFIAGGTGINQIVVLEGGTTGARTYNVTSGTMPVALDSTSKCIWLTSSILPIIVCNKLADHSRRRTQANVEASSDGDTLSLLSLYGSIQAMLKNSLTATPGLLTVYKVDGVTVLGTETVTTDPTATPIVGIQ